MMRNSGKYLCLFILLAILIIGCQSEPEKTFTKGKLDNRTYSNEYFNLKISFPDKWIYIDSVAIEEAMNKAKKTIGADNTFIEIIKNASHLNAGDAFFMLQRFPLGVAYTPSFRCSAEKVVTKDHQIDNGKEYLEHARQLLKKSEMDFVFPNEPYTETIQGKEFHVLEYQLNHPELNIPILYKSYVKVFDDYALIFMLEYFFKDEVKEFEPIWNAIQFDALQKETET